MPTSKKAAPSKTASVGGNNNGGGMNEYAEREHQARLERDKERLKDPNLNEHNKQEIREKIARESKR